MKPTDRENASKPEPLWTARLECGCDIIGYNFSVKNKKKSIITVDSPIVIYADFF